MKNIFKQNKKYEAMGFVEALIAIMVVGAASVVLMDIAVRTMQDVIQNETIDTMTQLAVEGAEMAQEIAKQETDTGENLFPDGIGCYGVERDVDNFVFAGTVGNFDTCSYVEGDEQARSACAGAFPVSGYEDYFRIICFDTFAFDVGVCCRSCHCWSCEW